MKTNISGLMSIIAENEKKLAYITNYLEERIFNETIIELNGNKNVVKITNLTSNHFFKNKKTS